MSLDAPSRAFRVMFVCGQNSVRSPMAAAIARSILPEASTVLSAGLRAGDPDPFIGPVLAEIGLEPPDRVARGLDEFRGRPIDLIIVLSPAAEPAARAFAIASGADVEAWPVDDPTIADGSREQILAAYRTVRDGLHRRIRERFRITPA